MHPVGLKEFVLLPESDCFALKSRTLSQLDIPLHYHSEYELNLLENGCGGRRIVSHHFEETTDAELVLIGPDLKHGWQGYRCRSQDVTETCLHFHSNLFSKDFLRRHPVKNIQTLLSYASKGLCFTHDTVEEIAPLLKSLNTKSGFESLLLFLQIVHILSISPMVTILPVEAKKETTRWHEDRVEKVLDYVRLNFADPISLKQVAGIANMTEVSFSRFFKQRTGKTFVECVNEIRIDHASKMLADTTNNVAEIAFSTGFNNISNFNRIFKTKKNLTPTQFREVFSANNLYRMCS